jgi:hypothetical protein
MIGLIGQKGSGKDTVADFLVEYHGYQKLAYAAPLKRVCRELFLLDEDQLHDPQRKEEVDDFWGMTPRQMMQRVGTDLVRTHLGQDFWLKHMDLTLSSLPSMDRVVISDIRFPNEATLVRRRGGRLIRIVRTDQLHHHDSDTHASEKDQMEIEVDEVIVNDHRLGIDKFYERLTAIFPIMYGEE